VVLEQVSLAEDMPKSQFSFRSLSDLVGYFKHLSGNKNQNNDNVGTFGDSLLLGAHLGKISLFIDKYLDCAIPDIQLEFLFESQGIADYSAYLDPSREFKHCICSNSGPEDIISELFIPNVKGDHFNPYIRFKSSSVCGSQQCSKLMDLAGPAIKDLSAGVIHDNVYNIMVLTFPEDLAFLLLQEQNRSRSHYKISKNGKKTSQLDIKDFHIIDRMNRCLKRFFVDLHDLLGIEADSTLGMSSSLHLWGSEFPFLPHPHFHLILPHFSYINVSNRFREDCDILLDPLYQQFDNAIDILDLGSITVSRKTTFSKVISDKSLSHKYIINEDLYNSLKRQLSIKLGDLLGFQPLDWSGSHERVKDNGVTDLIEDPLPLDLVKQLWSDIVYNEFSDILKDRVSLDIHSQYCTHKNKAKLLHALQYKTRPAVLDLDLFLKKCPHLVYGHNDLDPSAAVDMLQGLFVSYSLKNNVSKSKKYEGLLLKAEKLFARFGNQDILSWLRFLSTWGTETKTFGFWRNLKYYSLDPLDRSVLVKRDICPICGGAISPVRFVSSPVVDSVIIRSRSKFLVINIGDG